MIKKLNLILLVCYSLLFSLPSFSETGNDLIQGAKDYLNEKSTFKADYFMGYISGSVDLWNVIWLIQNKEEFQRCF
jgi:hypothetical protein